MNYEKKVRIINKMEEVYDITFTESQIDVLLGDISVEMNKQEGKTFVIACKALLESIVSDDTVHIEICVENKKESKNMKDYICVLAKKMDIKYDSTTCELKICNGIISIGSVSQSTLVRGASVDYLLIDNLNIRPITSYGTTVIEVINKNGIK